MHKNLNSADGMPQSYVQIPLHIIFSTQNRTNLFFDRTQRIHMHKYIFGICKMMGSDAIQINGPADHIHLLCYLGKQKSVCDLVRVIKASSSKWFSETYPQLQRFHWQKGYAAFGADPSAIPNLVKYIKDQEAHHRNVSYKEEFRQLCSEAGLILDERFVWE